MPHSSDPENNVTNASWRSALTLIVFGFGILAFLVAIDHPQWFRLKPSTGTAMAMSKAVDHTGNSAAQQK